MSDVTLGDTAYLQSERAPALPPPSATRGPLGWMRQNLFSSPGSTALTLLFAALVAWIVPGIVDFALLKAVWHGDSPLCRANPDGACWPFIAEKFNYLRYGAYPIDQRWRVDVVEVVGAVLISWLLWTGAPRRNVAAVLFFLAYPVLAFFLLRGAAWLGLPVIDTSLWGGVLITLLMSVVGIVFSLPLGVLLALGRRSDMPMVKAACITFIEFVRGVPFIIVLFMANFMLPLFVPDWLTPDRLLRPLIGTMMFAAAYMAEIVRAGLQAMPKGQYEGAHALGLGYWPTMRLVVLPQALTTVIPGIVSTFIGLFKDTTLVAIVGIADFLRTVESARLDPNWAGPSISPTGYLFAAIFYWVFCFGMSRYSLATEHRLNRGRKH
ncbi:amino acid ABC transporter permease [Lichenihabitans sp. Uapishka_5]|uniref:amino acid ABC transporter permease n=1 Tax=Lichenihabitans sp. Uapishka_5 TaxID=3037302 RepID=UPI0029E7E239|nr:amino acid ABC transporter permease [Lichenihabitans sp. Uapishka_5]MDX7951617.1 amino acid ABC transporter permease [Lichenihabitans sp. Uapishka_5]